MKAGWRGSTEERGPAKSVQDMEEGDSVHCYLFIFLIV